MIMKRLIMAGNVLIRHKYYSNVIDFKYEAIEALALLNYNHNHNNAKREKRREENTGSHICIIKPK